jgi:hypothetical protein
MYLSLRTEDAESAVNRKSENFSFLLDPEGEGGLDAADEVSKNKTPFLNYNNIFL